MTTETDGRTGLPRRFGALVGAVGKAARRCVRLPLAYRTRQAPRLYAMSGRATGALAKGAAAAAAAIGLARLGRGRHRRYGGDVHGRVAEAEWSRQAIEHARKTGEVTDEESLADWVLAHGPEYRGDMDRLEDTLARGCADGKDAHTTLVEAGYQPLAEVLADLT